MNGTLRATLVAVSQPVADTTDEGWLLRALASPRLNEPGKCGLLRAFGQLRGSLSRRLAR
jgi:hypothetical protein